ncbi:hypothetical protein N8343_08345 [Akkermansiaceae bacterium]|nr:hypothetical protein [Akkermansiaceae bacterium]
MLRYQFTAFFDTTSESATEEFLRSRLSTNVSQRSKCIFIVFQHEISPETGRHHFQGYAQFDRKVRFKKIMAWMKQVDKQHHVEIARSSSTANIDYCTKDASRAPSTAPIELGASVDLEARQGQGQRTDIDELQKFIDDGHTWFEIAQSHFATVSSMHNFANSYHHMVQEQKAIASLKTAFIDINLRPWQISVEVYIKKVPDARKVLWIQDTRGNLGKSFLGRFLQCKHNALILQAMKKTDMIHLISKHIRKTKIVIFDVCRTSEDGAIKVVYEVMESLKNGYLVSGKYDSCAITFEVPHVLIMSNYAPDRRALSADRWKIMDLDIDIIRNYETIL